MDDRKTATHIWVGFNEDGKARAFCWDDPGREDDTLDTISEWRRVGRTAARLPKDDALRLLVEDGSV